MTTSELPQTLPAAAPNVLRRMAMPIVAIFALIAADQLSKWWVFEILLRAKGDARPFFEWLVTARHWSVYGDPSEFAERLLAPFANLVMVWNKGVSFGLFAGTGAQNPYILVGVAAVITAALLGWLSQARDGMMRAALVLIISGAIANVYDRLRFGAVADFMDLHVAGYHWPAFNIADSAIVIGAALLVLDALNFRPAAAPATPEQKG